MYKRVEEAYAYLLLNAKISSFWKNEINEFFKKSSESSKVGIKPCPPSKYGTDHNILILPFSTSQIILIDLISGSSERLIRSIRYTFRTTYFSLHYQLYHLAYA